MMMKVAFCLTLCLVTVAAGGGCFLQKDYACVNKGAVVCDGELCFGSCGVKNVKTCDTKVWFKTVCEEEDYCKKIEIPCGHDGSDVNGLFCGAKDSCLLTDAGYTCVEGGDLWKLDESLVEVTCKKEYKVVQKSCDSLFSFKGLVKSHFWKMNSGFDCGSKIVGKTVCVEADIKLKVIECGDSLCEDGYECATREVCKDVALNKPVCGTKSVFSCIEGGSSVCGNRICGASQKCEIFTKKVCPQVFTSTPTVTIPGSSVVIPKPVSSGVTFVPGVPTTVPGAPIFVPGGPTPVPATPATPAVPAPPAPVVPLASVVSSSLSDALGTVTYTDAVANGGNAYTGAYSTGDYGFSRSDSGAFADGTAIAYTDVDATLGYEAEADAFATSNPRNG